MFLFSSHYWLWAVQKELGLGLKAEADSRGTKRDTFKLSFSESNLRDRVLGEVEKDSFMFCQAKRDIEVQAFKTEGTN